MSRRATLRLTALTAVFLAAWVLAPGALQAATWRAEPGLAPAAMIDRLAERHPEINSAADLTELITDFGRRRQLGQLEARWEGGVWVLHGQPAALVKDIEVAMMTRMLRGPVLATVQNYLGQVDSPEVRSRVRDMILRYMKRRGYPEANARVMTEPEDNGVAYQILVTEGDPCVVDRLELGFKLPQGLGLDVSVGDVCDREEIEAAIAKLELELRDRGYNQLRIELADIIYDAAKDTAQVFVSGVLGQRVRYEIQDLNKRFLIDDLFADEELTKVDPTIVGPDAMAAELARRYRNRGFLDAQVKGPEVKKTSEDEFIYVYSVDPGKQYQLMGVQFEGVTVFKDDELLDTMGLTSFWQANRPMNYEEVQDGLTALRARYQAAGYWDAKVRDPGTGQKDKDTGTVRLTIQVDEGLQRRLGAVTVTGAQAFAPKEISQLLDVLSGAPLDRAKLVDFQQAIRAAYVGRGYLYAEAKVTLTAREAKRALFVDVAVTVTEGPRVKIGDVTVVGLARTEEKVVRRELLIQPGDWYDPERITDSRQALTRMGLFRSVQIAPADRNAIADKEREIDLLVDVREGKAGNVSFGPGWSLLKGWNYGAEASYTNIGGVGRQASVRGAISEERDQEAIGEKTLVGRKVGTGYLEPYIFDWPIDARISAKQDAEWGGRLWELAWGGELELIYKLRAILPGSRVSGFYGQKVAKTEGSSKTEEDQLASDVRIGQVGTRFNLDRRDNLKFPTSGFTTDAELAWARYALGGDLRYFRWDVGASWYQGIVTNWVFALGVNLTAYEDVERRGDLIGILPPSERLSSGGADTVRGYRPGTLGPLVRTPDFTPEIAADGTGRCLTSFDDQPLDGSSRTTIKTELRYKVNDSLATTGFVDNGNTFFSKEQMRVLEGAYADPVRGADRVKGADGNPDPLCADEQAFRTVEDNIGYDWMELLKNPGYAWSRHYWSYGASLNLLTALGSVNFAYGLPWREPKTEACAADSSFCNPRGKQSGFWALRGEFHLNVGARF